MLLWQVMATGLVSFDIAEQMEEIELLEVIEAHKLLHKKPGGDQD